MCKQMIIEGIVTTRDSAGVLNIAPMGARCAEQVIYQGTVPDTLTLRPYRSSQTFRNLSHDGLGVFHVTDDVELLARAAVGDELGDVKTSELPGSGQAILADACRWYALKVQSTDATREPAELRCRVTDHGHIRDFAGLNRGMLAVVEAAILATRIDFHDIRDWQDRLREWRVLVDKTGGTREQRAFQFVESYFVRRLAPQQIARE